MEQARAYPCPDAAPSFTALVRERFFSDLIAAVRRYGQREHRKYVRSSLSKVIVTDVSEDRLYFHALFCCCLSENGAVLLPTQVGFHDGESVFDILERTLREKNIHMEFTETPMYESTYIEGIANLYEFDCGELSGWMYKVNGIFSDYGSSLYEVKNGDIIEWVYTCDKGKDVGKNIN